MKKTILLLLFIMLLPIVARAHDFYVDGIYYNIINDSEVAVTYKGSHYYSYSNEYTGNVVIPESVTRSSGETYSVTAIGDMAFYECYQLTNIDIPNSVSSIGKEAFERTAWYNNQPDGLVFAGKVAYKYKGTMPAETIIDLPEGTRGIADMAFSNCTGMKSVTIPNSIVSIGINAFSSCRGLTSIDIPNSVTYIGKNAFYKCSYLTSIQVEEQNSVYDSRIGCNAIIETASNKLIVGCMNTSIPNTVTSIDDFAFNDCRGLTNVTIPNSVTSIGRYSFASTGLASVDIPNSVTTIGPYAFEACTKLKSISISASVSSIGLEAFGGCSYVESISIDPENPIYDSRNNCNAIIETASNRLIQGCQNTIIPNSIRTIDEYAFHYCTALTNITIPNSVTHIGDEAFYHCSNLTDVIMGDSLTYIGSKAFEFCTNLKNINLPNCVSSIGSDAFKDCNSISTLFITGVGEWKGVSLSSVIPTSPTLYIDSRITAINGMRAPHFHVYCYATTPPECNDYSFYNYNGALHVPATSLAAYFTADYWCNFANIVGDAVEPININLSLDSLEVNLGDQFNLSATVFPANATPNNIIWLSTNPSIATVSNGMVSALGLGECEIIAQCLNKKAICHVIVNDTTVTITLDLQEAMVLPNHIITLTPSASPIVPDLSVTSSDPSVAAARVVNHKVQVVGIKEGTTTITVGSVDGTAIPATCLVTVYTEPGDLNSDGFVTISDVTSLIDYLLGGDETSITTKNADVNGDGNISISDVTSLIDTLLSGN